MHINEALVSSILYLETYSRNSGLKHKTTFAIKTDGREMNLDMFLKGYPLEAKTAPKN